MTATSLQLHIERFLADRQIRHYSPHTLKKRRHDLGYFIDWCHARSLYQSDAITRAILEQYRSHVYHYKRKTDGQPLSVKQQGERLIAVRTLFHWLTLHHHLITNPASTLELPKAEQRLPRHILTVSEIAQILNSIDTSRIDTPSGLGIRNRAMLETLYSTGMRRSELVSLQLSDLDTERGTLLIRQGKGKKDRMVPIGERALLWIERYVRDIRSDCLIDELHPILFLSKDGQALSAKQLSHITKQAIDQAKLSRLESAGPLNASCHLFRHACATHMLENGADIRYIQALLGHAELSTTEVYTRVAISMLKDIHTRTHPAKLHPTSHA